ncbi:family 1 glycosylhydrolase [Gordonia sp. ABSL49_1]|uniref:family 1 glycosylhydrolase n=1 Tax=unclassified Gordonia (in: high G+C Gram-positive bacteria) TaxID=2657482 RepID=UPI001F0D24C8|nr:family 1 glycosylhydrolase [Gordonia sp. ABSL49_1]MCH5641921.1 family 1 glycosylhydrolase [Gordonia sp. ABSL49_1]
MRQFRVFMTMIVSVALAAAMLVLVGPTPARAAVPDLGPGFQFGVAQSGFQSEGYNRDSNWLRYGKQGKVDQPVGRAVDFFHQYRGDIARAKSLGVGIYRTSIEWSRVQPAPGRYDPAGWAFYDRVIRDVVDSGMRPMITLNHWVHPGWEVDRGGWNRAGMAADLVAFANRAVNRYAWANPLWITFNEPTEYVRRELMYGGVRPENLGRMVDGIIAAHRAIYRHIHAVQPGAQVSSNLAYFPVPGVQSWLESLFPERLRDTLDFVGVDHYYSFSVTDASVAYGATGEFWKSSQAPESIYYVLRHVAQRFPGKPIRVVENGLATDPRGWRADGYRRGDHLRDTVYWLQRAKQDGVPVVSYNYWSLTDNYEWGDFDARFGLYTVDAQGDPSLKRHATDGVVAYRAITAARGVPVGYRPTRMPVPCSLVAVPDSCTHPAVVR